MSLKEQIQNDLKQALKNKEEKLSTLRMLWSAIRNEEINKQKELDDLMVQEVTQKQVKQLQDALSDFEAGNRKDLAEKNKQEITILENYLPEKLDDAELKDIILQTVKELAPVSSKDFGKVMGLVMKKVQGRGDGNKVKDFVSTILSI